MARFDPYKLRAKVAICETREFTYPGTDEIFSLSLACRPDDLTEEFAISERQKELTDQYMVGKRDAAGDMSVTLAPLPLTGVMPKMSAGLCRTVGRLMEMQRLAWEIAGGPQDDLPLAATDWFAMATTLEPFTSIIDWSLKVESPSDNVDTPKND